MIASRYQLPIGHVEAGLRSRDKTMPEEVNRILVDHLSKYLFAPSPESKENLTGEGITEACIWITGNTIVDATHQAIAIADISPLINKKYANYILLTLHRPSNVDSLKNLREIIEGVQQVSKEHGLFVVFPIHPRTKSIIQAHDLKCPRNFHLLDPIGYLDCLRLQQAARLIMTDSGGIQEEACILNVPCVTLRRNTERPETLKVGANMLGGVTRDGIIKASNKMLMTQAEWEIPFGDGQAAEKIVNILISNTTDLT